MKSVLRGKLGVVVAMALGVASAAAPFATAQPYSYAPHPDYYRNDTAGGTVTGGVLGAVTGAIVGGRKNRGEGALIGAGIGAVTGNLMGRAKDRADEQRAATGAAVVGQMNQQAAASAITNYDLLEMTRAGVSEDVMISTMRARGTRLDLSPNALISLKQSGVSDRVVLAAQDLNRGGSYIAAPAPIVAEVVPAPVVVVPPPPRYYYGYGPRYYHHHHHYRPRTHIHYSVGF
jgi:uncharacterized protein YcfJ